MQKSVLIKKLKKLSQILELTEAKPSAAIALLNEFLKTKPIKSLKKRKQISAKKFLLFIQVVHPEIDVQELFAEHRTEFESNLFKEFLHDECEKKAILGKAVVVEFEPVNKIKQPVSAILPLPDGKILTGLCYAFAGTPSGKIALFDESGKQLKEIAECASAFALLPNGNVLSSTCWNSKVGTYALSGSIVERSAEGEFIQKLSDDPASALVVLRNGNILSSASHPNTKFGEIVLRDASAQYIKTLSTFPALALAVLPNGNFLSGDCHSYRHGNDHITMHDPDGRPIQEIRSVPVTAFLLLADYMLTSRCNGYQNGGARWAPFAGDVTFRGVRYDANIEFVSNRATLALARQANGIILCGEWHYGFDSITGEVTFNKLILSKRENPTDTLVKKVEKLILDNAVLVCVLFHKNATSLPNEVLELIYSYVFPFPNDEVEAIIDPELFASNMGGTQKTTAADKFARNVCNIGFFLANAKAIKDMTKEKESHGFRIRWFR